MVEYEGVMIVVDVCVAGVCIGYTCLELREKAEESVFESIKEGLLKLTPTSSSSSLLSSPSLSSSIPSTILRAIGTMGTEQVSTSP